MESGVLDRRELHEISSKKDVKTRKRIVTVNGFGGLEAAMKSAE
jgi:hypothetical protein